MTVVDSIGAVGERRLWRSVAVPSEHGGWGLTLEPVLLGLLIAPSIPGVLLGIVALVAFLVRTPLKLVVIDARRGRWLNRSRLAMRIAIGELVVLATLASIALPAAGWSWLVVIAIAAPLVGVEFWFDVRSRGRRLIPELCGAAGIASVTAVIMLAGGRGAGLAIGAWLVLCARAVGSISFIRVQIARLRRQSINIWFSDAAQFIAIGIGVLAVVIDRQMMFGLVGLLVLAVLQLGWVRRTPLGAKVMGVRQMMLGVGLVAATAIGAMIL